MAIFHMNVQVISRSSGRSAVAASAYRSGEKIVEEETGQICDYSRRHDVVFSEILLCDHAPSEYADRQTLWNAVEKVESRHDAQLAREMNIALPKELTHDQQIALIHNYVKDQFVSNGMCADIAIHDKNDGNPHAHILLTCRPILSSGKWGTKQKSVLVYDDTGNKIPLIDPKTGEQKTRSRKGKGMERLWVRQNVPVNDWNSHDNVERWRASWAKAANLALERAGRDERIDHRSNKRRCIKLIPTQHLGSAAADMERRGIHTSRGDYNRNVRMRNAELMDALRGIQELEKQLDIAKKNAEMENALKEIPWRLEERIPWLVELESRLTIRNQDLRRKRDAFIPTYQVRKEAAEKTYKSDADHIGAVSKSLADVETRLQEKESRKKEIDGLLEGKYAEKNEPGILKILFGKDGIYRRFNEERDALLDELKKIKPELKALQTTIKKDKTALDGLKEEYEQKVSKEANRLYNTALQEAPQTVVIKRIDAALELIHGELRRINDQGHEIAKRGKNAAERSAMRKSFDKKMKIAQKQGTRAASNQPSKILAAILEGITNGVVPAPVLVRLDTEEGLEKDWDMMTELERDEVKQELVRKDL